jgi:hypothetical protein
VVRSRRPWHGSARLAGTRKPGILGAQSRLDRTRPVVRGNERCVSFCAHRQAIDRKLYDHVNAYTAEPGSDGVIRATSANLNATYVRLVQRSDDGIGSELVTDHVKSSPLTAFKIVSRRAHSGRDIGILSSVKDDGEPHPTLEAVMRCLNTSTPGEYSQLTKAFALENDATQTEERVDIVARRLLPDWIYLIDQFSMVIFRVRDDQDNQIAEFDLKLTAVPPTHEET